MTKREGDIIDPSFLEAMKLSKIEDNDNTTTRVNESSRKRVDLNDVFRYLSNEGYPSYVGTRNEKSNFRRQSKQFYLECGKLMFRKSVTDLKSKSKRIKQVEAVRSDEERQQIIKIVHQGRDTSKEAQALSGHRGRDSTVEIINERYFWPGYYLDINSYIEECEVCQKVNRASLKVVPPLIPVPVPKAAMAQIGVDLIQLPEVDGFKYVVVAIDYFSKWSEAKPLIDKSARSVARFLYEQICRHGCMKVQINDQGREFVNSVSNELHRLTGVSQRVTSAYHPQANGLVERQNQTIKNMLLKVLLDRTEEWPNVLDGVIFAHRSVRHRSTGYSPFYVLYQRHPVLPVDLLERCDQNEEGSINEDEGDHLNKEVDIFEVDEPFNQHEYARYLTSILALRSKVEDDVDLNIKNAQEKYKTNYDKRRQNKESFAVGDEVLVRNLRRSDRKGGWSILPWSGPYVIVKMYTNSSCSLQSKATKQILKQKQKLHNLKKFKKTRKGLKDLKGVSDEIPVDKSCKKDKVGHEDSKTSKNSEDKDKNEGIKDKEEVEKDNADVNNTENGTAGAAVKTQEIAENKKPQLDSKRTRDDHIFAARQVMKDITKVGLGNMKQVTEILKCQHDVLENISNYIKSLPTCQLDTVSAKTLVNKLDFIPCVSKNLIRVKTTGRGNCLYNAISINLTGDEELAPTLRLLTAHSLCKHNMYFDEVIRLDFPHKNLNQFVLSSLKLGEWGESLHIQALSIQLNRPIYCYQRFVNRSSCMNMSANTFQMGLASGDLKVGNQIRYAGHNAYNLSQTPILIFLHCNHFEAILAQNGDCPDFSPKTLGYPSIQDLFA